MGSGRSFFVDRWCERAGCDRAGSKVEDPRLLLTIESTCDETAAAVIDERLAIRSSVVASQDALHQRFGGVVPEIAARAHLERILPVIDEALRRAETPLERISAVAVTNTPGLAGSLLVGLSAAKALALALRVPLIAVNHLEAHLYACRMTYGPEVFPAVGLVVSGGHTHLFDCLGPSRYEPLGSTIDDAAGEAFDKVAQLLGLGYPGGPAIERAAAQGNPRAYAFPRAMLHDADRLDFSFSGLKTAVRYALATPPATPPDPATLGAQQVADLAASFQQAVVDVLVAKSLQAVAKRGRGALCVGGGVAANGPLGSALGEACRRARIRLYLAPRALCTDNAAMAALAVERWQRGDVDDLEIDAVAGLVRG